MKVLVIEDEKDIAELLEFNLQREGYEVCRANNGEAGLEIIESFRADLVLLDLMLPAIGGIEVARRLRGDSKFQDTMIIMLTARGSEADVILGFEVGADDYVVKPFSPMELMARIRAHFRRKNKVAVLPTVNESKNDSILEFGSLVLCNDEHWVKVNGFEVPLTRSEFDLLHALCMRPGKVFNRDELLSYVVGDTVVGDRTIDVHIAALRKKLDKEGHRIETIRGVGYRLKK